MAENQKTTHVREVNGHTWYQGPMACDVCKDHQAIYCEECGVITLTFHDSGTSP